MKTSVDLHGNSDFGVLLNPGEKANTAGATGAAFDLAQYEGNVKVIEAVGAATAGTLNGKIQHSHTTTTGDFVDLPGATFPERDDTDNANSAIGVDTRACRRYIRYVGTIATGPFDVGVILVGQKKY